MMIQFYKPNPKNTGSACSFFLTPDGSIMSSMIKQDSWDAKRKRGSFSKNKDNPKAKALTKYSQTEAAAIVDAIERNVEWSAYHSSQHQIVKIGFGPYVVSSGEQKGFSYSINKEAKEDSTDKVGCVIGLTFPEARLLKEYLCAVLQKTFENTAAPAENNSRPQPKQATPAPSGFEDEDENW